MLSQSCKYGIWAVLYMASDPDRDFISIREISNELKISFHFLTKILQSLTRAKIIVSMRGANGGVSLARPAKDINLHEIIVAIDGDDIFTSCVLGLPGCGNEKPCPLHNKWVDNREAVTGMCENTNLKDLALEAESTRWLNSDIFPGFHTIFKS